MTTTLSAVEILDICVFVIKFEIDSSSDIGGRSLLAIVFERGSEVRRSWCKRDMSSICVLSLSIVVFVI